MEEEETKGILTYIDDHPDPAEEAIFDVLLLINENSWIVSESESQISLLGIYDSVTGNFEGQKYGSFGNPACTNGNFVLMSKNTKFCYNKYKI